MVVWLLAVASPEFGARRDTKVSGCLHQATVDVIVTVTLCINQSVLKIINCCKSRGARAPVPHSWRHQWLLGYSQQ